MMNLFHLAWLVLVLVSVPLHAQDNEGATLRGGEGTLFLGGYAHEIYVIDEATEQVVDAIQVTSGIPRSLTLSTNREHFYLNDMTAEHFEIIDIASRSTLDTFSLSGGNTRNRIEGFVVDPQERYVILLTRSLTKLVDRFEIGPSELSQYDLSTHEVIRTIPFPDGKERQQLNMLISPDGSLLYFFVDQVVIYETTNFTEVDRWDLSEPFEPGLGSLNFGFSGGLNQQFGIYTGLFTVRSPRRDGRQMGVARVDLNEKEVDYFYMLGPAARVGFSMTADGTKAYGFVKEAPIGHYELWAFDLENRRLGPRQIFDRGRPRMQLTPSSNGQLLYVWQAGQTIDIHEASTFRYLRTIDLEADSTTSLIVLPPD